MGCLLFMISCTSKSGAPNPEIGSLAARGRTVYQTQCIACHNPDPHKAGALGPDVFGASRDLLEARILRAEYPAGYQPKRQTHTMAALPHLKADIEALHSYLNSDR